MRFKLTKMYAFLAAAAAFGVVHVHAQAEPPPGVGYPHSYPGKPYGDFSPAWQQYFEVTHPLPNVTFPLPRSWAGNIPVDRPGHPNDTLFFWGFEKEWRSLTGSTRSNERGEGEPWGIWLNGGPGTSSLLGMLFENGPLQVSNTYLLYPNKYGWNYLADYFWIDQPVGVGYSTADETGFVADEDQVGEDFFGFLENLVKVFPSLRTRPLYLTGESYAGTYIPYIMKKYFGLENPPVKLAKIAIGGGAIGNIWEFAMMPTVSVMETYPQLIGYDPDVFQYFKKQSHLCGFDLNLTYPQHGHFPTLTGDLGPLTSTTSKSRAKKRALVEEALRVDAYVTRVGLKSRRSGATEERLRKREQWKRDLTGRLNGTIDPYYGCDLHDELIDYALNFSLPWKGNDYNGFDYYNVVDALEPEAPMDASVFLNDNATRAAIHAPTSKDWVEDITYPFAVQGSAVENGDPSVEPMAFFSELATNASDRHVGVVIYSGNDDPIVPHLASEVVIQNTTFGGIQGFTRRPSTPWFDDSGDFAGIVHQERNWTYVLVKGAGHFVPQQQPARAYVFLREFVLGNNRTGLVVESRGVTSVVGSENSDFAGILTGQAGIYYGSGTTEYTYFYPSLTVAAWQTFIAEATATSVAPTATDQRPATRTAP